MRQIEYIILHCTATPQNTTIASIQRYWREVLKWKSPGYHRIIDATGKVHKLAEDAQVCNGVAGQNIKSIHISYIGGVDAQGKPIDNRTMAQRSAMEALVREYKAKYPTAAVQGHNYFTKLKACPSFDVATWLRSIGI